MILFKKYVSVFRSIQYKHVKYYQHQKICSNQFVTNMFVNLKWNHPSKWMCLSYTNKYGSYIYYKQVIVRTQAWKSTGLILQNKYPTLNIQTYIPATDFF